MGVRAVKVYAGDKLVHTFNGSGGCCAVFMESYIGWDKGADSLVAQFDTAYVPEKFDSIFRSKMVQALVPGTEWVKPGGGVAYQGIRVPFKDLPGDQVATVLRIAKNWFFGHYNSTLKIAKELFPELEDHEQAVIAVVLRASYPDSDGAVCFWSPTTEESLYNYQPYVRDYGVGFRLAYQSCDSSPEDYKKNAGIHAGSLLKLLRGEIKPGIQPAFKERGYYKAGSFPSYFWWAEKDPKTGEWCKQTDNYMKGHSEVPYIKPYGDLNVEPTVNYPVIHRCWDTPLLINHEGTAEGEAIRRFRKWIDDEKIVIGDTVGKQPLEAAVEEPSVQLPTTASIPSEPSIEKPKRSRKSSSTAGGAKVGLSSTASSAPSGVAPGRVSRSATSSKPSLAKKAPAKKPKAEPKRSSLDEILGPIPF